MTTEFHPEDIAHGRQLVDSLTDCKWELGDLALEVCPPDPNGSHDRRLARFAAEIDLKPNTLRTYRYVAFQWPELDARTSGSWSVYKELAGRDDRFDIIAERDHWTVDALRVRLDLKPTRYPPPPDDDEEDGLDDQDDLIDPAPPAPGPHDRRVEARRIAGYLDAVRMQVIRLVALAQDDDLDADQNEILAIIRPAAEQLLYYLMEAAEKDEVTR